MTETPPSPSLRLQTNLSTKQEEGKPDGTAAGISKITNGGDASGSSLPYAGEMERRGEEKLLDERIRERYQKEIGDIFDD